MSHLQPNPGGLGIVEFCLCGGRSLVTALDVGPRATTGGGGLFGLKIIPGRSYLERGPTSLVGGLKNLW